MGRAGILGLDRIRIRYSSRPVPRPAKTLNFTLDLLRRHTQIHFEDAVRAAEAQGLSLSRATFYKATKELGIRRRRGRAADGPALADRPQSSVDVLVRQLLDKFRRGQEETRRMRAALERIREVLRDALVEDRVRDREERASFVASDLDSDPS